MKTGRFTETAATLTAMLFAALAISACGKAPPRTAPSAAPPATVGAASGANENLHAVLWTQTAVEFKAVARQCFALASIRLDAALADPAWTAALEQEGEFSTLPPAIIMDVDETVLDNSVFQARGVRTNADYDENRWRDYVREVAAEPIPGAVEFAQYAQKRGVTVFYVTNRNKVIEEPTRENLQRYGFPLDAARDTVLTQDEIPAWQSSDKSLRRRAVAGQFRVLLLVGDDLGDFVPARVPLQERLALYQKYFENWGTRWIVVPNPSYGSWEGALFDYKYDLPRDQKLRQKNEQLRLQNPKNDQ